MAYLHRLKNHNKIFKRYLQFLKPPVYQIQFQMNHVLLPHENLISFSFTVFC